LAKIAIFNQKGGVGKTTTIAKLAALYGIESNGKKTLKVRIITIDNYRIGAGPLRQFLTVFGFALDNTREFVEGLLELHMIDETPMSLLKGLGANYGLPYESGILPSTPVRQRFSIDFYLTAMLFIVFDIELAFLYPIAVVLRDDGVLGLVVLLVFVFTVVEALVYIWKKGALEWR